MAASAYKGLTIRIGADTTKLSSALRGANSAIYKTEREFRKLSKAAKLDPGNTKVVSAQMGAVANMAVDGALKMERLRKSISEVGETSSKSNPGMTIAQLAKTTENAALDAEMAKERYNALSAEIEQVSDSLADLSGIDPSKAVRKSEAEWEKAKKSILDWSEAVENAGAVDDWERRNHTTVESTIADLEHLRETWMDASREFDDASLVESLHNAEIEATATEATINHLGRELAELDSKSNLGKSFGGLDDRLEVISSAADIANDRLQRMSNAVNMNPGSMSAIAERARALADATEVARAKAQGLQEKINGYKANGIDKVAKSVGNVSLEYERSKKAFSDAATTANKLEGELREAQSEYQRLLDTGKGSNLVDEINKAEKKVEDLEREFEEAKRVKEQAFDRFDTAKMCKELQDAETEVKELEASTKDLGNSMDSNLSVAAVHAASQIGQLMREAGQHIVESANDVDAAYRDMRKTVDGTEEQYQKLYDAAMKYSQTHVTSADTMLEMEALAGQVGISADALENFAEVAANLDVATDISADEIALKMGQIVNVMSDLDENNVRGFADALVDLGNKMPAQESAIMQIAQRLSSVGDVAGFSTPEVLGWAAAIASTGQRSEAAATGISTTISSIQSAVSNGGDDLEAFAKVVGKSSDEFKEAWGKDASGVLRDFIGKLKDLGPEAIAQLEDLGIEGVRQTQTLLGLAKTVENVDKAMDISNGAWDGYINGTSGIGAAADEASKKADGFSGSLAKMQNSLQVMWASLGPALKPLIDDLASGIQSLTEWFNSLDDSTKTMAVKVGAAFAAFAVGEPIVGALVGNLKSLASGAITKTIAKFILMKKEVGKLNDAFLMAKVTPLGLKDALAKTGSSATGFASGVESLGAAFTTLATSGALAAGAVGAVALAVGAYYVKKFLDAKKHAEDFANAIGGIEGTVDGLHEELLFGKDAIDDYAESWSAAGYDVDDFLKSTQEHVDAMKATRDETGTTVGMLERYRDIIDKATGAGDNYTGSMGELQWALDGIAEVTGDVYTAEDILSGTFEGEAGNADKLRDAIFKLIDAKKKESQLNAITEMRTEAVKGQMEAADAIDKAAESYKNYFDVIKNAHGFTTDAQVDSYINTNPQRHDVEYLMGLKSEWDESKKVYDEWGDKINKLDNEYDGLYDRSAYMTSAAYGEREGIIQTTKAMKDACDQFGITNEGIKQLAQGIQDAGVSTDEFRSIGGENFALMAQMANGDIQSMIDLIGQYNEQEFEEKYGELRVDGYGNVVDAIGTVYEWNGTDFVPKYLDVETNAGEAAGEVSDLNQQVGNVKGADPKVNAKVTGKDDVQKLNKAIDSVPKNPKSTLTATVRGKADVNNLLQTLASANGRHYNVTFTTTRVTHYKTSGKPAGAGESATGAYIPYNKIPKHAAGIFTRPTLTNIGWVGEDGAELYSGNSLVPLTNRKYSMPYINDISDAVARKIGGTGTQYNVYIDGARVNDDPAIQAAFLGLFDVLQRKGAMNRG